MKLEDARIGMTVVDKFGNEYDIIALDESRLPAKLRCVKINNICRVGETAMFYDVDDEHWIVDSEEAFKEYAGCDVEISLESIKPKDE